MSYPSTLDSFATPGAKLSTNPHSSIETAQNTALNALETKIGIDGSAVTASIDYKLKSSSSISPGHLHVSADLTDLGSYVPTGAVLPYAGSSAPTNFLICNGTAVSRTTYAALFALTSTSFGVGDGSTTFNLPDLRSRVPLGLGTGTKVLTFSSRSSDTLTITGSANSVNNEVQTGQAVVFTSSGTTITGLTSGVTYYIIRVAYNQFKLAINLGNAMVGTQIVLSGDGTGTRVFTITLSARALGDTGGEEGHNLHKTELPDISHSHPTGPGAPISSENNGGSSVGNTAGVATTGTGTTYYNNTGLSAAIGSAAGLSHNIMSSFVTLNYIIRI